LRLCWLWLVWGLFTDGSRKDIIRKNVNVVRITNIKKKNMSEQLYTKKNGRYVAVNDPHAYDGLGRGTWLVVVKENGLSARNFVNPKIIELEAALHYLREGLCDAMYKASEMRPSSTVMSKNEKKAWKAFKKIVGKDMPRYFQYDSIQSVVDKGCEYVKDVMAKNNCDVEEIKEKYEVKKNINSIFGLEPE